MHADAALPRDDEPTLPVAAVLDSGGTDIDALLAEVAGRLSAQGRMVRGLVMHRPDGPDACGEMWLRDLHSGAEYRVSQALGAGSNACRADPDGFARAGGVLRAALQQAPDLVISNRFGGLEVGGGGFSAELLALMAAGQPLLTAVPQRHLGVWQAFTGGAAALLPADVDEVMAWLAHTLPAAGGDAAAATGGDPAAPQAAGTVAPGPAPLSPAA